MEIPKKTESMCDFANSNELKSVSHEIGSHIC